MQSITVRGKPVAMGLAGHPLVRLAKARGMTADNVRVARDGGDPRTPDNKCRRSGNPRRR